MKKLYTTLALAATLTATASAGLTLSGTSAEKAAELGMTKRTLSTEELNFTRMTDAVSEAQLPSSKRVHTLAVPEGDWTSLGQATWFEDLLTIYSDVAEGQSWKVDIEESATTPGYYRIAPYTAESPIGQLMGGKADETAIFYINATNPDKVYIDGDVMAYRMIIFSHVTSENDWDADVYATLKDGVISFDAQSVYYTTTGNSWNPTNSNGGFKIALPGAVVKDYSLRLAAPYCAEDNNVTVDFKVGPDVSSLKYYLIDGYMAYNPNNNAVVAQIGSDLPANITSVPVTLDKRGMYTLHVTAMDNGTPVNGAVVSFFMLDDEDTDWNSFKDNATYEEGFLCAVFSDVTTETLSVKVQEHASTPGYFRLVDPYSTHSEFGGSATHSTHKHYIYINATNPERVYLEPCPIGVSLKGFGSIFGWSQAHRYVMNDMSEEAATAGLYGRKEGNVITMPDQKLLLAFDQYDNGQLYLSGKGFKVTLPTSVESGVGNLEINADAPAEYFNLQGIRVSSPTAGQLYIVRQADKTFKQIIK